MPRNKLRMGTLLTLSRLVLAWTVGLALPCAQAATYYVDALRPNDSGAATNWATAKQTIQAAVNLAAANDTVLVTNGVYKIGTTVTPGASLSNRVVITKAIAVRSVSGPAETVIEGSGTNAFDTASAVRCAFMTNGVLDGFTLRGGATYGYAVGRVDYDTYGGGISMMDSPTCATVTNCVIQNSMAAGGGAVFGGTLNRCTLRDNTATLAGGGACYSALNHCTLLGNATPEDGGGSYESALNNCLLAGNTAAYGGGSSGGTLVNCTISGNTASTGGGIGFALARNCIVWGNVKPNGTASDYFGYAPSYSCTSDPQFVSATDLRLREGSPCLDTGDNAAATWPTDLLGAPRIQNGRVDMGVYEGFTPTTAAPVFSPPSGVHLTTPLTVTLTCVTPDSWLRYTLDGSDPTETSALYTAPLTLTSTATLAARAFSPTMPSTGARVTYGFDIFFVDASRPDDSGNGLSWGTAKKTIQAAVDVAVSNATVIVTNGVYNTGTTGVPGDRYSLRNNRVAVTKAVTVRSVNGPAVTVIEGSGAGTYATPAAVRCVYMSKGVLEGFTLRGGATSDSTGYSPRDADGGGVFFDNAVVGSTVTNCVIENCQATFGGGAYGGTLNGCTLSGNTAVFGGGSYGGTLSGCTLSGNTASLGGGGDCHGTLNNCTLSENVTSEDGGGAYYSVLNNCAVLDNSAAGHGGGSYYGTLTDCVLSSNSALLGGGSYRGTLRNCTLSGNAAAAVGGSYYGTLINSIVWGNTRPGGVIDNYSSAAFTNSCTTPLPSGVGNLDLDPHFVDATDLRLRLGSPCLDAGSNAFVSAATDLLGDPRIQNGTVDMGAYEGGVLSTALPVFGPPSGTCFTNSLVMTISCATESASVRYTLDGSEPTGTSSEYAGPLTLTSAATVSARAFKAGMVSSGARATYYWPTTYFVDAARPDDSGAGTSWATAKRTIQAAVDLAATHDEVLVTNGVYNSGVTIPRHHALGNRVVVTNAITLRSVNGPEATIIEGSGTNAYGTASAVRCVYMMAGMLDGFTLQGGATLNYSPNLTYDQGGGGLTMYPPAAGAKAANCIIRNCAAYYGGGSFYGTLSNCALTENSGTWGGAVAGGMLDNCTVVANRATSGDGGANGGRLSNSIVWGNVKSDGTTNNYTYSIFTNSCTTPLPPGLGNLDANPQFVSATNLRLRADSPCLDAGDNAFVTLPTDLLGNARIQNGTVDMGAYEGGAPVVARPVITPASGATFSALRKVTISCATVDAEIRYTLDGGEPLRTSSLYTQAFNIAQTTTVSARAFKDGVEDSLVATATYFRALSQLNEAVDATNILVTTGGSAGWFLQTAMTHDGVDAARSGGIADNQSTWMETTVTGPGTLSFWWKTSCEDDPDADNWDTLLFSVDGAETHRRDGLADWQKIATFLGPGSHTLRWEYRKDETLQGGEDCAWVDQLSFARETASTPVPVPHGWLDQYPVLLGLAGGDYEAAALADVDGDGHAAWQEYVAGSVPTDGESVLRTHLELSNGVPWVTWTPDLGAARTYTVGGKASATDVTWGPTNAASRFFRASVRLP